jgi:DNA-binding NarL/FixJ family response regulator
MQKMKYREDLTVFVVDGSSLCRYMYKKHLLNLGFSIIHSFENASQCLAAINMRPDIILLDFDAIPENSFNVIKQAKFLNPDLHVIMISAQQDVKVVVDALRFGVSGYVMKDENQLEMMSYETNRLLQQAAMAAAS